MFILQMFIEQLLCAKPWDKAVNEADTAPTLPLRELQLGLPLPTNVTIHHTER